MRHGVVGIGADLADVIRDKASTGYAGPIGPDYRVLIWKDGEWRAP